MKSLLPTSIMSARAEKWQQPVLRGGIHVKRVDLFENGMEIMTMLLTGAKMEEHWRLLSLILSYEIQTISLGRARHGLLSHLLASQ